MTSQTNPKHLIYQWLTRFIIFGSIILLFFILTPKTSIVYAEQGTTVNNISLLSKLFKLSETSIISPTQVKAQAMVIKPGVKKETNYLGVMQASNTTNQDQPLNTPLDFTIAGVSLRPAVTPAYTAFIANHEIKRGDLTRPAIALTFDCGSHTASLVNILQTLKDTKAKGTFFLEGNFVKKVPNIVLLILAGGHDLGNHSYSHSRFTTLTQTQVISEVQQTEVVMAAAAGQPLPMRYFRFPYGDRNQQVREWLATTGYQSVFWDIDPKGWQSSTLSNTVVSTVVNQAHPGAIVLMHCGTKADEEALPTLIAVLQAQGYVLETVANLLSREQLALGQKLGD